MNWESWALVWLLWVQWSLHLIDWEAPLLASSQEAWKGDWEDIHQGMPRRVEMPPPRQLMHSAPVALASNPLTAPGRGRRRACEQQWGAGMRTHRQGLVLAQSWPPDPPGLASKSTARCRVQGENRQKPFPKVRISSSQAVGPTLATYTCRDLQEMRRFTPAPSAQSWEC